MTISFVASDFLNWFYVRMVLIGLLVCVKGKAKPTAAASERGFGKYGRSIAGDVDSPSLLPPPPLCCCCCCCAAVAVLLLLLLPLLLLAAAAAAAAAAVTAIASI